MMKVREQGRQLFWHLAGIVVIVLLSTSSLVATMPMPTVRAAWTPLFSDNFEEYPVSSSPRLGMCSNYNPTGNGTYWGGPAGTTTAFSNPCSSPTTNLATPANVMYWNPASGPACTVSTLETGNPLGGCEYFNPSAWTSADMSPNAIFAIVNPALDSGWTSAWSGSHVLKIGIGDADDKQSGAVYIDESLVPDGSSLNFTFHIWLSSAADNMGGYTYDLSTGAVEGPGLGNDLTMDIFGIQITYRGWAGSQGCVGKGGQWRVAREQNGQDFDFLGCYHLPTMTWHAITITENLNSVFTGLYIDGTDINATIPLAGKAAPCDGYFNTCTKVQNGHTVYTTAFWINSGNGDVPPSDGDARASMLANESIYQNGQTFNATTGRLNAWYIYLDDVSISLASQQVFSSSNTTISELPLSSWPYDETFGVANWLIVALIVVVIEFYLIIRRRYSKLHL